MINGGVLVQGQPSWRLLDPARQRGALQYQRAGDEWTGSAALGFASLVKLSVNGVISDGKLDDLGVNFACSTSKICGSSSSLPTIGAVLDLKDVDLNMINLQGIDYTPPPTIGQFQLPTVCAPSRFRSCPPPEPAPQIDGAVIIGVLGDRVIAGGDFDYLLDGAVHCRAAVLAWRRCTAARSPIRPPLVPGQSATNVVDNLLNSGFAGVELASAAINYTPPNLLQATGTMFLPPLPFPVQFLKGTISIGISHPTSRARERCNLVVPSYVPVIGGDSFGAVQALISDEAAAAEASLPQYCVSVDLGFHTYTECTPKITFLAAYRGPPARSRSTSTGATSTTTRPSRRQSQQRAGGRQAVRARACRQAARLVHDPQRARHAGRAADRPARRARTAYADARDLQEAPQPHRGDRMGRRKAHSRGLPGAASQRRAHGRSSACAGRDRLGEGCGPAPRHP